MQYWHGYERFCYYNKCFQCTFYVENIVFVYVCSGGPDLIVCTPIS